MSVRVEPPVVGRDVELRRMDAWLGDGQVECKALFITGAMGMGKSRLVRAVADRGEKLGMRVWSAQAWPLGSALALAPVIQTVGAHLEGLEPHVQRSLTDGLPMLEPVFGGLGLKRAPSAGDPALEKTRVFEAIASLLGRIAAERPVLWILEDLHDADRTTVELLNYCARRLGSSALAIVATWRVEPGVTDAPEAAHVELTEGLTQAGLAERWSLGPLPPEALTRIADHYANGPLERDLMRRVLELADGCPLFAAATVIDLVRNDRVEKVGGSWALRPESKVDIPDDLVPLLRRLVDGLEEPRRRVLEALVCAGPRASFELLLAQTREDEVDLERTLDRAVRRGVLREHDDGTFSFVLPALHELVHGDLSHRRRRGFHQRAAEYLARTGAAEDAGRVEALARHYAALPGLVLPGAMAVLVSAGDRAMQRRAAEDAVRWFGAALARSEGSCPGLHESLGDAHMLGGQGTAALEAWGAALTQLSDTADRARVASKLVRARSDLGDNAGAIALSREVLADVATTPGETVADLILTAARVLRRVGDDEGPVELARIMDAWPPGGFAYHRAMTSLELAVNARDAEGVLERAGEAVANAHTLPQRLGAMWWDISYRRELCEPMLDELQAYVSLLEEHQLVALQPPAFLVLSHVLLLRGQLREAAERVREGITLSHRIGQPRWRAGMWMALAEVLQHQGDVDGARGAFTMGLEVAGREPADDLHPRVSLDLVAVRYLVLCGDLDGLRPFLKQRKRAWLDFSAEATRARGIARTGDPAVLDDIERLRVFGKNRVGAQAGADAADAYWQHHAGEPEAASRLMARAADGWASLGWTLEAALARLSALEWDHTLDPDGTWAKAILPWLEACGAGPAADRCRACLRDRGVRVARPSQPAVEAGTLSPRELEVATLAASGLTNAQIGARLFISKHTVATHIKNVYARIGVRSRAALAKWVADGGG